MRSMAKKKKEEQSVGGRNKGEAEKETHLLERLVAEEGIEGRTTSLRFSAESAVEFGRQTAGIRKGTRT